MADLGTMVLDLQDDLDEIAGNVNRIQRTIGRACDHHRGRDYHFLKARFELALKDSTSSYGLSACSPKMSSFDGPKLWLLVNGNREDRSRVIQRPWTKIEDWLTGTAVAANFPTDWAVHGNELLVYPPPAGSDHILTGWGRVNDNSPRAERDPATNTWDYPDLTFTNIWFDPQEGGYHLIREYAAWLMCSAPLYDKDRAREAAERYREIERAILLEGERRQLMLKREPSP